MKSILILTRKMCMKEMLNGNPIQCECIQNATIIIFEIFVGVDVTKARVNARLEKWRQKLEARGFKLILSKTRYL